MQRGGGGNSLRVAIATVVKLLTYMGVCGLTPETLRQCKFDSPEPTRRLWRALHDVVLLVIAGLPEGNVGERLQQLWHRLEEEEGHQPECAPTVEFVQYYLGLWGYPSPELYARKAEDGQGSRGLLLALAWTLSHHHILDVAVARQQQEARNNIRKTTRATNDGGGVRVAPREAAAGVVAPLPPYPQDTLRSVGADAAAKLGEKAAAEYVAKVAARRVQVHESQAKAQRETAPAGGGGGGRGRRRDRRDEAEEAAAVVKLHAQQTTALHGRLQVLMNRVDALERCRQRRTHAVLKMQLEHTATPQQQRRSSSATTAASSAGAAAAPTTDTTHTTTLLSPYELHLLRNPSVLNSHRDALAATASTHAEQAAAKAHVSAFFEWMGSVLEEERKAAAALPQSSRLPPPPPAAADPSRPNPLLSMPTAELRALTAQLEGDIEQTMQHHKQDMEAVAVRWSQVNVTTLPPHERAAVDEQLQLAARKHRVPQTDQLAADALYHISISVVEPREHQPSRSEEPALPEDLQVLVRSVVTERDSIRSTSVAADARIDNGDAWLHVYHSKDGTVAVPGACAASQPVGETTEAADAVRRVQEALDSVTERLDSVQSHHQLLLQSALDPLIRSPTHVVVGL